MKLAAHEDYARLVALAEDSHQRHRSPQGITAADVARARLYAYGLRLHAIGAFHATRVALAEEPPADPVSRAHRTRAVEALEDLANQAMEDVPADFRVVISTLYRYHRGATRVIDSLSQEAAHGRRPAIQRIGARFAELVSQITGECGIHLTRDTEAPEQAAFVVPNLGIVIVPLVYGDHHSWNLAWLAGAQRNVPTHRHQHGVEIHLGCDPTHGVTVLGQHRAAVDEGYAMPIPPRTDHGWVNQSAEPHHVPFIFGSLVHGGWGVFLDVEPQRKPVEELTSLVSRDAPPFKQMAYLEREIRQAARLADSFRKTLIPHTVTHRGGSGGLELNLTRVAAAGFQYPPDSFRIVSIARGAGLISIEGVERAVAAHDHFGIPAGLQATLRQTGAEPLVALDALIRSLAG